MHDALDAPLELRAQRDHVASVPLGDQHFLQVGAVVRVMDDVVEFALQPVERDAHLAPDGRQLGTGRVLHGPGVVQHAADLALKRGAFFQPLRDVCQARELVVQARQQAVQRGRLAQRGADVEQCLRLQGHPARRRERIAAHVARAADGDVIVRVDQQAGFGRFLLAIQRFVQVGRWRQIEGQLHTGRKRAEARKAFQNLRQFERRRRFRVHGESFLVLFEVLLRLSHNEKRRECWFNTHGVRGSSLLVAGKRRT